MGLFSKKKSESSELNAFMGVGTEYRGKLNFVGTVRIDGHFEGEITTDGALILGRKALVVGNITVGHLTSCGRIEGNVVVKQKAFLEKTSILQGTLTTPSLVMEQGALLEGGISMHLEHSTAWANVVSADFGHKTEITQCYTDIEIGKTGSEDPTI